MKRLLSVIGLMTLLVLVAPIPSIAEPGTPTIKLLNPPPKNKPLVLAVGESYTFDIQITSDEPFAVALAMTNAYYPGRGVFWHGSDRATQATSAVLQLTMTGKAPTADLWAVCDWPGPGDCWPEGVAPVAIAVGVRFADGQVVAEQFPFAVLVP